ncbi:hypothetical protein MAPG_03028, partial [Magnaporthiopsis poae ATCC 64411]
MKNSSFGDPNVRPPASPPPPQKTPTTTVHPSPVFETPRPATGHLDHSGSWTPHFAEEYSLFNATPGNLRASPRRGFFPVEFGSGVPFASNFPHLKQHPSPALGGPNKRHLSAEDIAEETTTHATHFSPNPNLPFPPVDPSLRLPSSPGPLALTHDEAQTADSPSHSEDSERRASASGGDRSAKKARLGAVDLDDQGQTATPPPSSTKGRRKKLAPKVKTKAMQNEQGFGDFSGAGTGNQHHPNMGMFVTSPADMFGFSMSAPVSAHSFVDSQQFWETEAAAMAGMELEFSAAQHAEMFQTPATAAPMGQHRPSGSLDWGRANQMFQETGLLPHQQPEQQQQQQQQPHPQQPQQQARPPSQNSRRSPVKRERPLAPKTMMPAIDTSAMSQSMMVDTSMYQTPIEDSFGLSHGQSVDPGMLFSRPPSSSMEAVFNPMQQQQQQQQQQQHVPSVTAHRALAPASSQQLSHQQGDNQNHGRNVNPASAPAKGLGNSTKAPAARAELRRANSVKESGPSKRGSRAAVSSPVKPRPGLSRSFSENRGRHHQLARPSSASSTSSHHTVVALENQLHHQQPAPGTLSRPSSHDRLSVSNGRVSPLKSNQGHRLPSLTSIPESSPGAVNAAAFGINRASVKFTIDANGRARVETVVAEDEPAAAARRGRSKRKGMASGSRSSSRWDSTDDDGGPAGAHDDDDASSTDDEPIIIPSRNTSFALPDPLKVSGQQRARYQNGGGHRDRASQRSLSVHSAASSMLGGSGGRGGS